MHLSCPPSSASPCARALRFFPPWLLVSAPLLAMLAVLALCFGGQEAALIPFFKAHREAHPLLAQGFGLLTDLFNPIFYGVFLWLLIKAWREKRPGLKRFVLAWIVMQLLVALLTVRLTKIIIGRPRPEADGLFQPMTTHGSHHSLPSGHTTEAATTCMAFALRLGRAWPAVIFGCLLALLGFSRIYLGWHHPSDVFFGWALGGVAGFGVHLFSAKD